MSTEHPEPGQPHQDAATTAQPAAARSGPPAAEPTASSIAEYLAALKQRATTGKVWWYRGHAKHGWKLLPNLARDTAGIAAEDTLIKRFKQNAVSFLTPVPADEWSWLFIMQHYGLKTRLLDWTESPLVALYFAVFSHPGEDARVWVLDPRTLNEIASIKPDFSADIPAFGHDQVLDSYRPSHIFRERTSSPKPVAAIATRNSSRIVAQLGTFTIVHREAYAIEELEGGRAVWSIRIPAAAKLELLKELAILRVTNFTLFPELQSVAGIAAEGL